MTLINKLFHPKIISLTLLSIGLFLILQIILPLISFQIWEKSQKINNQILISPSNLSEQVLGISVQKNKANFPAFFSLKNRETNPNYNRFTLSVPKLKISNMEVFVDTNDLSQGLAHLPGSALPGEKGNVFISGHSAFNPLLKVKSIPFAKLTDLKKGEKITVLANGAEFVYEVIGLKIVDPSDLSVIAPPDEIGRYISLMTCVPPGLNYKRLVVLGKMI